MNRHVSKVSFFIFLLCCITLSAVHAQKYGHINIGNLLSTLPEVAVADSMLVLYQDSILAEGETKAKQLQTKIEDYYTKANAGELTPVQQEKMATELEKEQTDLQNYEKVAMAMIQRKRQEFLAPLLKKVNDAIQAIGKENGYSMIFDTSVMNTVLYVEEGDDLMPLLKTKLGLK